MGSAAVFALDIIVTSAITCYLFRKYGVFTNNLAVTFIVLLTWFCCFVITLILPLDVSATFYWNCVRNWFCRDRNVTGCNGLESLTVPGAGEMCNSAPNCHCAEPWSYVNQDLIPTFWQFVYWTLQLLTWLILPLMESYISAGDFTFGQKMKSSLKENLYVYISAGILFAVLLIYVAAKSHLDASGLKQVVIGASNTWGLFLVICLLGYGLVDVPRWLWQRYNLDHTLRRYQFRAAKLSTELANAEETHDEIIISIRGISGKVSQTDPLRKYVNIMMKKASTTFDEESDVYTDFQKGDVELITKSKLVSMHKKLIKAKIILHRCRCQWDEHLDKVFALEDVIANRTNKERSFKPTFEKNPYNGFLKAYHPKVKWYWKVKIEPLLNLALAVICTLFSIALVWSEVLFSLESPTLSIYAQVITWAGRDEQYFNIELMTFITLFYLCICTYRVIFQLRVFNFYYLVPNQQTDSSSLLFSAMFLSRLTVPLCLNFLSMAHMDNHVTHDNTLSQETGFTQVMGHFDVISFLKDVNTYYPVLILFISFGTFFRLGTRVMSFFGAQRFLEDDEGSEEYIAEGKAMLSREKRRRLRPSLSRNSSGSSLHSRRLRPEPLQTGLETTREYRPTSRDPSPARSSRNSRSTRLSTDRKPTAAFTPSSKNKTKPTSSFSLPKLSNWFGSKNSESLDDEEELLPSRPARLPPTAKPARPPRNLFDDL
eukprot:m.135197 g.135197  ORF g.135197 m.135197 type:complete len:713 (-) comp23900_c0_seq1:167-2305(-)